MKNDFRVKLATFIAVSLVLFSALYGKANNKRIEESNNRITIEEVDDSEDKKVEMHYYNDTVNVEESIDSLGYIDNTESPYSCYKYIRYVDYYGHEKYAIVMTYVDYEVEDKKIVDTNYNCCNAFNGDLILRVHDIKNIKDFESNEVYYLMEYGSLLGLRNSVISKGLDKTYAYNVLSDGVYNKSLSLYDVARIYVLLVNSDNRVETNNIEKTIN